MKGGGWVGLEINKNCIASYKIRSDERISVRDGRVRSVGIFYCYFLKKINS